MKFILSIEIYGISKKSISKLQGESLKEYSHYIKKMFGKLIIQEDEEILSKLPTDVKFKIYKEMRYYFYSVHLKQPMNLEELERRSTQIYKEFYTLDKVDQVSTEQLNSVILNKFHELEETISDPSVDNSFINGRYGHLDEYIPNVEALFYLAQALRKSVKLLYPNAITIVDGAELDDRAYQYCSDIRYIFPDENSKIYVVDGKTQELTRIYSLKLCDEDSTLRSLDKAEELLVVPELGQDLMIKKLFESSSEFKNNNEAEIDDYTRDLATMPERFIILYKDLKESKVIYTTNGKRQILFYNNGKLIFEDPAKEPWIEDAIELFENRKSSHRTITPFETLKNALKQGGSTYKTNEAYNVEQSVLNLENVKEGDTKDDQ